MPDNTINWGQGTVNNTNDWGGAKANSANSFGAVYDDSPSGDTNIVGGTALSITYSASAYCDGIGDTPQPTVAGNTGAGTFSSTAGLTINSTTGVIDVDASTKGATYVVTYTDTDSDIATANVTLNALDNAAFSYSASSYTQADTDPTPTITGLTGGTFSGTTGLVINSTTGEIDLSASTIASHTVTYSTSSSGSSVCPNTSTFSLAVTASFTGLLDTYTGSEAAYSLRRLSSSYTGNLIRVTKKVSNVISETDIGYNSSNELDTAALATFASGADNGEVRVVIWYDQSGNSNNVTHSTYTQLPKIYESGSLITENSKPALRVARNKLATTGAPISSQQSSIFYVTKVLSGNNSYDRIFSIGTSSSGYFAQLNTIASPQTFISWYNGTLSIGGDLNSQRLITFYNDSTTQYLRQDGVQIDSDSKTPSSYGSKDLILFGDTNTNKALVGIYQEFIFYPSEQSSNLTGIETNIKNYHGI